MAAVSGPLITRHLHSSLFLDTFAPPVRMALDFNAGDDHAKV
jgi:hypothetical protein